MNSIFTFDHGQKKLNKAIGVQESYMDELQEQMANLLKNHLFDENKDMKDDLSPSMLVEACLSEFSYSQLVIIASFYLQDKLNAFGEIMEKKVERLKVEKEISEKIVANSDEYSTMIMRDYSQIHMMSLMQKVYPNFRSKFLTKDLVVNVPVDRKEQIQKIIIILDYSGSMDYDQKQIWVNAILIDRFKYVMKGEAEVFFSYFVHSTDDLNFQHIKDRDDVIKFWQTFSNDPNGGMTEVGDMVEHISNEIQSGKLCNLDVNLSEEKPEILVINDGNDSVGTDAFPYKVNAVSLMEFSSELKDLCLNTGGKQIEVTKEDEVFTYSVEAGKQELKS